MLQHLKNFIKKIIPESLADYILNIQLQNQYKEWESKNKPIPSPHKAKQVVITEYCLKYNVNNFVETGTYLGFMVNAMKYIFTKIYSIELSEEFYKATKLKFKKYPHIHLYQGDSSDVLPIILKEIKEKTIFWLDGHYSGQNTAKGNLSTPIIQEIEHIKNHSLKTGIDHIILIDDARCFDGTDDYPTQEELKKIINSIFPGYDFSIKHDIIRIVKV